MAGVKTGFKPLFYLAATPFLKGAEGRNLHKQRTQQAQWIEVLYKVRQHSKKYLVSQILLLIRKNNILIT